MEISGVFVFSSKFKVQNGVGAGIAGCFCYYLVLAFGLPSLLG
jgi:hypothetical protein